ncbi:four-helix bundle copper-binding protein [Paenarthrobacter sp. TYUT067]|uniref:four-helix bundle copper-binding protein n=1 Tax=unclassified Paenarthrobacter TaxID=2634190 RepID=UPI00202FEF3A|nr:four-helix bundle copper-binding protein [Paenarthrobacter sp. TYUT067]MCM0616570.1 four-helix bundle copper-binding protein [Paenarthrobacter sp. TYUT067]
MSHHISAMIDSHPEAAGGMEREKLAECIAACFECAQTCGACADACLGEDMVAELTTCIRTDLDCADVCAATGAVLSRQTGTNPETVRAMLEACRTACGVCAQECEQHAGMHGHCKICAQACRRCEAACADLLAALA